MEKLKRKINNEIKIEVNDNGEYITINLADVEFPQKFMALFEGTQKQFSELSMRKEQYEMETPQRQLEYEIEISKSIMKNIDYLLGEGACKKVFGDIVPDIYAITDFFEELIPIMQKYGKQRNTTIQGKYSHNRKGSR